MANFRHSDVPLTASVLPRMRNRSMRSDERVESVVIKSPSYSSTKVSNKAIVNLHTREARVVVSYLQVESRH